MSFVNKVKSRMNSLRLKIEENRILCFFIPLVLITVYLVYYLPFYGTGWISDDKLYAMMAIEFKVINPFSIAPIIMEVLFLAICYFYTNLILKLVFGAMYAVSNLLSLAGIMGYTSLLDFKFYAIQAVIIISVMIMIFCSKK